jgi:hypothetical protein
MMSPVAPFVQILIGSVLTFLGLMLWIQRKDRAKRFNKVIDETQHGSRAFQFLGRRLTLRRWATFDVATLTPIFLIVLGIAAMVAGIVRAA